MWNGERKQKKLRLFPAVAAILNWIYLCESHKGQTLIKTLENYRLFVPLDLMPPSTHPTLFRLDRRQQAKHTFARGWCSLVSILCASWKTSRKREKKNGGALLQSSINTRHHKNVGRGNGALEKWMCNYIEWIWNASRVYLNWKIVARAMESSKVTLR